MCQAHTELEAATTSVLQKQGLQQPPAFVHKVVQLHETLGVRFGVMLVGQTGTGKSTLLHTLQVSHYILLYISTFAAPHERL